MLVTVYTFRKGRTTILGTKNIIKTSKNEGKITRSGRKVTFWNDEWWLKSALDKYLASKKTTILTKKEKKLTKEEEMKALETLFSSKDEQREYSNGKIFAAKHAEKIVGLLSENYKNYKNIPKIVRNEQFDDSYEMLAEMIKNCEKIVEEADMLQGSVEHLAYLKEKLKSSSQ